LPDLVPENVPDPAPSARHIAAAGDLALFVAQRGRQRFPTQLVAGEALHTHKGIVPHDDVIGRPWGSEVTSHMGERYVVLRPSMEELLVTTPRKTQIVFPKDVGYILLKLSITPGTRVIEAGSGSGALTTALATYVSPGGQVYSYEMKDRHQQVARKNIERLGLSAAVTFHLHDVKDGFHEREVDALFLDMREPEDFLPQAWEALAPGGFLGTLVPTINQVIAIAAGLSRLPFADIEIAEILLRQFRPGPARIRPDDRLTAHTGYLLFARRQMAPPSPAAEAEPAADAVTGADDLASENPPQDEEDLSLAASSDGTDSLD